MGKKPSNAQSISEAKKLLVETHLVEYGRLREEILALLSQRSSAVNYSLIILAALITLLPSTAKSMGEYVLLVAAMPFLSLSWYIASVDSLIARVTHYLQGTLIPKVQELITDEALESAGISREVQTVLGWEHFASSFARGGLSNVLTAVITGGRNMLVFGPAPVLVVIFIYITKTLQPRDWIPLEVALVWANIVIAAGILILGLFVRRRFMPKR
jgi:hypothetical protein